MTDSFEEEIKSIAGSSRKGKSAIELTETDKEFLGAIEEFYVIARRAVTYFNSSSAGQRLSLQKLTPDSLDLFLDIQGRRGGFSISSPSGIVVLFDEDPDLLTVIGRRRKSDGYVEGKLTSAIQLIKIRFRKENGVSVYRDNSGGAIDPHDIVALLIRWVSSV
ncbi:MAG: hypothetical protein ACHQ6U_09960 [Thermodesulfobacteriota bacterium]